MKTTPLYEKHLALSAKMVEFAGFQMPVQYAKGVSLEHETVRKSTGVFDVSHMGEFSIKGLDAKSFAQYALTNNVEKISAGKAQYTCLLNSAGKTLDDCILYQLQDDDYMLVVNASNIDKDFAHLQKIAQDKKFNVKLENGSEEYALLAVQGPKTQEILQTLCTVNLSEISYYHFAICEIAGVKDVIISNTGYTGAGGFELYIKASEAVKIWDKLMAMGVEPIGLAARDTLRLEMGFCLYGHELSENTNPLEANLAWVVKFEKDFIGKDALLAEKSKGLSKKLIAFELLEKAIPRQGYTIFDTNNNPIGEVTSGSLSLSLNKGIGLGYANLANTAIDSNISIKIRDKFIPAKVCTLPFVEKTVK